jgi:hypothetical protein
LGFENGLEVPSNFKIIIRTQIGALSNIQILKRYYIQNLNWTSIYSSWVGVSSPTTPKIEPGCNSKGTNCNCPCI